MNLLEKRKEKKVLEKRREERERLRKDIENLEAEMERNEAVFNLTTDEFTGGKATFFKDPDGMPLEIHE